MRGKDCESRAVGCHAGITPAHAGKSKKALYMLAYIWDHPRSCGEKCLSTNLRIFFAGSPPLMRGKARYACIDIVSGGITPAHAGKSLCHCLQFLSNRDHPRSCGEKIAPNLTFNRTKGSPPLMRGKAALRGRYVAMSGITPAHAGKRLT